MEPEGIRSPDPLLRTRCATSCATAPDHVRRRERKRYQPVPALPESLWEWGSGGQATALHGDNRCLATAPLWMTVANHRSLMDHGRELAAARTVSTATPPAACQPDLSQDNPHPPAERDHPHDTPLDAASPVEAGAPAHGRRAVGRAFVGGLAALAVAPALTDTAEAAAPTGGSRSRSASSTAARCTPSTPAGTRAPAGTASTGRTRPDPARPGHAHRARCVRRAGGRQRPGHRARAAPGQPVHLRHDAGPARGDERLPDRPGLARRPADPERRSATPRATPSTAGGRGSPGTRRRCGRTIRRSRARPGRRWPTTSAGACSAGCARGASCGSR